MSLLEIVGWMWFAVVAGVILLALDRWFWLKDRNWHDESGRDWSDDYWDDPDKPS